MNAEKINDSLVTLTYLTDNAQGATKALYELAQCDDLMNSGYLNGSTEERMKVHDLLRTHDTCARLVCIISDMLESIMQELDKLDVATIENHDGIQDTEMLCTAICPQRMKPDGIQTEKRTPPETCAEPQKKGKSGGAQK